MGRTVRGRCFVDGELTDAAFRIEDGKIAEVGDLDADVDHGDEWILPAATDVHVHLREPGYTHKETIEAGTRAAARGGVVCVLDMPNTDPATDTVAALEDKVKRIRRRAHVDVGCYVAPGRGDLDRLFSRATGVKLYWSQTSHVEALDKSDVPGILQAARDADRVVAVHAEDPDAFTGSDDHWRARPPEAERRAVDQVMEANEGVGADLHIAHATLADTLERAPSAECAPHHLLMDRTAFETHGNDVKCNPPLRDPKDRERLWDAFRDGDALLATDHAPHTPEEKADGAAGIPGVETMVPLMLAEVLDGDLELARLVEAACSAPPERFGFEWGRLEAGHEASYMVVDPDARTTIDPDELATVCGWTPFEGWDAVFPERVVMRGEPVVDGGEVVGGPRGEYLGGR